jgi:flagellar protein FlgJ
VTSNHVNTFNFADFQGFAALRRDAANDDPQARRAVAQQFEALFVQTMLTQMRAAAQIDDGLFDHERLRTYESMHDQQLALTLSRQGGIGLADSILRQLGDDRGIAPHRTTHAFWPNRGAAVERPEASATGAATATPQVDATIDAPATDVDFAPASPEEFVAAVWPHAQRAAAALGIDADVLVAQAALESGWGAKQITVADGRPSFNLFGVKAAGEWDGARVRVATLEYVAGVPERRREAFRVYASLEDSFSDYVRLVSGQSRYRDALGAEDAEGYLRALQAGGYATDPAYADKVLAIVRRGLPGRPDQEIRTAADNEAQRDVAQALTAPSRVHRAGTRVDEGVVL